MSVTAADVAGAAERVAGRVRRTPVLRVDDLAPVPLTLKLELFQHAGSFKVRGAFNRVLSAGARDVIAASGGNHGLAVAHVARSLGVRAEIFVPEVASPVKVAGIRALGAEVVVGGAFYADAYAVMLDRAAATGALVVHAYDMTEVAAGQGTVGLELREQAPDASTVLVAVGGGGLLAGVAAAYDAAARIVAVEPRTIPTLHAALAAGQPVDVEVSGVAADSLGARRIGEVGWAVATRLGVTSVLVDDADIVAARRLLWQRCRIAAEAGGAAALAAVCGGAYRPAPDEVVTVILCGGNTDPSDLG
jgi:threonine dehydratase